MKRYGTACHFREACLLYFLAGVSLCAFGQTEADSCLIPANGANGSINAHTTREDLVRLYGAALGFASVHDGTDMADERLARKANRTERVNLCVSSMTWIFPTPAQH